MDRKRPGILDKARPYHLLPVAAIILAMLSVVPVGDTLNLPLQGASYQLNYSGTLRALAMLLVLLWVLYLFTARVLFSRILVWIHIVVSLLLLACIIYFFYRFSGTKDNLQPVDALSFQSRLTPQMSVPLLILFFLFFQLIYVINLILGIVRRVS